MMRWEKIEEVGDTEFLIDEVVDKFRFISWRGGGCDAHAEEGPSTRSTS
jgi:hypothetical protein